MEVGDVPFSSVLPKGIGTMCGKVQAAFSALTHPRSHGCEALAEAFQVRVECHPYGHEQSYHSSQHLFGRAGLNLGDRKDSGVAIP